MARPGAGALAKAAAGATRRRLCLVRAVGVRYRARLGDTRADSACLVAGSATVVRLGGRDGGARRWRCLGTGSAEQTRGECKNIRAMDTRNLAHLA